MKKLLFVLAAVSAVAAVSIVVKRTIEKEEELPQDLPEYLDLH